MTGHFSRFLCLLLGSLAYSHASRVHELTDQLLELRHDSQWLVLFYAPWCGHCKRVEPIVGLVAQTLATTNIRVGRVDCTRYTATARHFRIGAYPTIMFIKSNVEHTYKGDRTKEELVDFALRMAGPPVQLVTRTESIDALKDSNSTFFLYVGEQDGIAWETYVTAAENYQEHGFFYATSNQIAEQHFNIEKTPAIVVYKEKQQRMYPHGHIAHEMDPEHVNNTIHHWVNCERFTAFPKITRFNMHQIMKTKKHLVIAVVEEDKLNQVATHELEFRDMIEAIIRKYHDRYHDTFQFGWIGDPSITHSILLFDLPTPHLIVVNSTSLYHHLPDGNHALLTPEAVHDFLESVRNSTAEAYGGDTYVVRLRRAFFEARATLQGMWKGNPTLTIVMFGLPLGFLSLIIYSTCCGDCMVEDPDDEDDHEKKE